VVSGLFYLDFNAKLSSVGLAKGSEEQPSITFFNFGSYEAGLLELSQVALVCRSITYIATNQRIAAPISRIFCIGNEQGLAGFSDIREIYHFVFLFAVADSMS